MHESVILLSGGAVGDPFSYNPIRRAVNPGEIREEVAVY